MLEGSGYLDHPNFRTAGHHDSAARLADYDHDGIAGRRDLPRVDEPGADPVRGVARSANRSRPAIWTSWVSDSRSTTVGSPTSSREAPHRHIGLGVPRRCGTSRAAVAEVEAGSRSGTARCELHRHARRRAPAVQPPRAWEPLWAVVCGPRHAAGHRRRRRHGLTRYCGPGISGTPAVGVGDVLASRGLVADLRRRVRTASRIEARSSPRRPGTGSRRPRPSSTRCTTFVRLEARTSR